MRLYTRHGRLSPDTGGTTEEGHETGGWGFDGPDLDRVTGFHCTYGIETGHFNVYFEDKAARDAAFELTGWEVWCDNALTLDMADGCARLWNKERKRFEYFGDWGMK